MMSKMRRTGTALLYGSRERLVLGASDLRPQTSDLSRNRPLTPLSHEGRNVRGLRSEVQGPTPAARFSFRIVRELVIL